MCSSLSLRRAGYPVKNCSEPWPSKQSTARLESAGAHGSGELPGLTPRSERDWRFGNATSSIEPRSPWAGTYAQHIHTTSCWRLGIIIRDSTRDGGVVDLIN